MLAARYNFLKRIRWDLELHLLPTLTPPQGCSSRLTSSHPVPATPANLRGPWAATRERLQRSSVALPVLPSNCLSAPSSSGLPSLSGACSAPGVACLVFASPTPTTPYQGFTSLADALTTSATANYIATR